MEIFCKETIEKTAETIEKTPDDVLSKDHIYCAFCNNIITNKNFQISINDRHEHTFANPHGIVYEIGCFSNAPGCLPLDKPSSEFTWFKGYIWRISTCNECQNHNGWLFTSDSNSFYGLILDTLIYD